EAVGHHEVPHLAVVIEVLHVLLDDVGRLDAIAGLERLLDDAAGPQVAHADPVERLALAGLHHLVREDRVRVVVEQNLQSVTELVGAVGCHSYTDSRGRAEGKARSYRQASPKRTGLWMPQSSPGL